MTTTREQARQTRIAEIRDGARVREVLGQAARHRRLVDGLHEVILRGRRFVGGTS